MMTIGVPRALLAILVVAALGACSGAGGVGPFATGANDAASSSRAAKSRLVLRVRVPKRTRIHRRARYISVATKAMTLTFTGPHTIAQVLNLTPSDPRCTGTPLLCTIAIDIPAGSYTAAASTYDQAPVGGAIPAAAQLLSTAAGIPVTVKTGIANTLALTLDGVPASILIAGLSPADLGSGFLYKSFPVTVADADNFTIVGTYSKPVVFTNSDTTGATAVTTSGSDNPPAHTLLSSGDTAALSYSGQAIQPATITATAGSVVGSFLFEVYLPLYVSDSNNNAVKEIPIGCNAASCLITIGGGFNSPHGVAPDSLGNVYVGDLGNGAVKMIPANCFDASCVQTIGGGFTGPWSVAVDHSGNVFVADFSGNNVKKIPPGCTTSVCVVTIGGGFSGPAGVALDQSGTVFVADAFNNAIKKMSASCLSESCVTTLNTGVTIATPTNVAIDGAENIYVAEPLSNTVVEIPAGCATAGCIIGIGGGFTAPYGVTVDWQSDVFVADSSNNAIKLVPPGCTAAVCVTTITTGLNSPFGIAVF